MQGIGRINLHQPQAGSVSFRRPDKSLALLINVLLACKELSVRESIWMAALFWTFDFDRPFPDRYQYQCSDSHLLPDNIQLSMTGSLRL
jgi:hypothetical protein